MPPKNQIPYPSPRPVGPANRKFKDSPFVGLVEIKTNTDINSEWIFEQSPKDNKEYWVTNGEDVFVAKAIKLTAGGWSNEDTWEDFDNTIIAYTEIKNKPTFISDKI